MRTNNERDESQFMIVLREYARQRDADPRRSRRRARREDALADEIAATGERRPMVIAADLLKAGAGRLIGEALATQSAEPQFFVNNAGFGLVGPGEGARSR